MLLENADFYTLFQKADDAGAFQLAFDQVHKGGNADRRDYVREPWAAGAYLHKVAAEARKRKDTETAARAMQILRTKYASFLKPSADANWPSWSDAIGIMATVPPEVLDDQDIAAIANCFASRLIADVLSARVLTELLPSLIASPATHQVPQITRLIEIISELQNLAPDQTLGRASVGVAESYWFEKFAAEYGGKLGAICGSNICEVWRLRIKESFQDEIKARHSYLWRPAVEDHAQNHQFYPVENALVMGLRDGLFGFLTTDLSNAQIYLRDLLSDDSEMVRRIGIYVLAEQFDVLGPVVASIQPGTLLSHGSKHESYLLLARHFDEFPGDLKADIFRAVEGLSAVRATADDNEAIPELAAQRIWLSALRNSTYKPLRAFIEARGFQRQFDSLQHPDFNSYHESFWGFGPSPYSADVLLAMTNEELVDRLNGFVPSGEWRSPSPMGLADALRSAIRASPVRFAKSIFDLRPLKELYRTTLIAEIGALWQQRRTEDSAGSQLSEEVWRHVWKQAIDVLNWATSLLIDNNRDRRASYDITELTLLEVARLFRSGVDSDDDAVPAQLLPEAMAGLAAAVEVAHETISDDDNDAVTAAINLAAGEIIEDLILATLMSCRQADRDEAGHEEASRLLRDTFQRDWEIVSPRRKVWSVFFGMYLPNLLYIDKPWSESTARQVFGSADEVLFLCASQGLAYVSRLSPALYELLMTEDVIFRILNLDDADALSGAKQRMAEFLAIAYLWGDEPLEGGLIDRLITIGIQSSLRDVAHFLAWSLSDDRLEKRQLEKLARLWRKTCDLDAVISGTHSKGLSEALIELAGVLGGLETNDKDRLVRAALVDGAVSDWLGLLATLSRLFAASPVIVGEVLLAILASDAPGFDFQNRMLEIVKGLAKQKNYELAGKLQETLIAMPEIAKLSLVELGED